jgi:uncharacterized protein (TIGR00255 family)
MIRSMTGYGEAELDTAAGHLRAEVRTVNHRYFSLNLRLGRNLDRYEAQIRESLRSLLPRGHVNFSLRLERDGQGGGSDTVPLRVDEAKLVRYVEILRGLKARLDLPGEVDLSLLSRYIDLVIDEEDEQPLPPLEDVRRVTEAAARDAVGMRREEGLRLAADLEGRLAGIETGMARIRELAPARLVAERDRMRRVVTELLQGLTADEDRIAREIAHIAERWDVSEELVRLRSHIELFRETLEGSSEDPVGKRLSFLTQEMNRETNTIGSKANDAAIEHQVIAIKDEIERLREQVENVE